MPKKLREFAKKSKIENMTSKLITFIEYFVVQKNSMKQFTKDQLIIKLEGRNSILDRLQNALTPQSENTLHVNLHDIINQKFAIPENAYDEIAFTALDLLYSGTQVYISVMFFLVQGYAYLANHYYQRNNVEKYNEYLSLLSITFKDFVHLLNGIGDNVGLLDKVVGILDEVQRLGFIQEEREDIVEFLSERKDTINLIKSRLDEIRDLPKNKPILEVGYDFSKSNISTPIGEWEDGKKVSYAIQFKNESIYSQVSDWSKSYKVDGKANPFLNVGVDLQGRERLIFRKFGDSNPELVGIIEDSRQSEFRDINKDLYNSVMRPNEQIAINEIDLLIKGGADINAKTDLNWTPLHVAAHKGNEDLVRLLMQNGVNVNSTTQGGFTPLHTASSSGKSTVIDLLSLDNEVDINASSNEGLTSLHLASIGGHDSAVRSLLRNNTVNINAKAKGGLTPLHFASTAGNLEIVKLLTAQNTINANEQSVDGWLPLHLAILFGKEDVALELLKIEDIEVNLKGKAGLTPLHLAAMKGENSVMFGLLDKQALVEERDQYNSTPLHFAAEKGNLEIVQTLVSYANVSLNARQQDGYTPLALAVLNDKLNVVEFLASKGASIKTKNKVGISPIDFAAWKGNLNMVKLLEEKRSDLSNVLHWAAYGGKLDVVKYLIETKGINLNTRDNNGKTPLHDAAKQGHFSIVRYLTDKGANLNLKENNGNTLMHFAALSGNLEMIRYLTEKEVDVKVVNNYNTTPLHLASLNGYLNIVQYFIEEKSAELNAKNNGGNTAMHFAASSGYLRIIKYLQGKGADVNLSNQDGWTPMLEAAYAGKWFIVKFLANNGANVKATNTNGSSALHFAARDGEVDMVNLLIQNEPNVDAIDRDGWLPAFWAARYGHLDVIKLLVEEKSADYRIADRSGMSLLHAAVLSGDLDMVKYLIKEKKFNVNVPDNSFYARSALHLAAHNGYFEIVKYLIEKSATINAIDEDNATPLLKAANQKNWDVVRYLIERVANVGIADNVAKYLIDEKGVSYSGDIFSSAEKGNLGIVKYFIEEKGKAVDSKNSNDDTPLHKAAYGGYLNVVKYLIEEKNANFGAKGSNGETPLHKAAWSLNLDLVKYLVEKGADIDAKASDGKTTPLFSAVWSKKGKSDVTDYLCSFYAKCNIECSTSGLTTKCSHSTVSKPRRFLRSIEPIEVLHHNYNPSKEDYNKDQDAQNDVTFVIKNNQVTSSSGRLSSLVNTVASKVVGAVAVGLESMYSHFKNNINANTSLHTGTNKFETPKHSGVATLSEVNSTTVNSVLILADLAIRKYNKENYKTDVVVLSKDRYMESRVNLIEKNLHEAVKKYGSPRPSIKEIAIEHVNKSRVIGK